jgi:chorismate-pyruvate lyase
MKTTAGATKDGNLLELLDLFPSEDLKLEDCEVIRPEEMPEMHKRLLVHRNHMTVTMERHHQSRVRLVVLDRRVEPQDYSRKIILTAGPGEDVVLAGVMRFHMSHCKETVRERVLEEKTPVGLVLMEHCALRRIEPKEYLRVRCNPALRELFRAKGRHEFTYGRTAVILCHSRPTVDLVEILSPDGRPVGALWSSVASGTARDAARPAPDTTPERDAADEGSRPAGNGANP